MLKDRPDLTREHLERTRDLMNAHVRDCLVGGYEHLIDGIEAPDPDDRHVIAAAVHSGADLIVPDHQSPAGSAGDDLNGVAAEGQACNGSRREGIPTGGNFS